LDENYFNTWLTVKAGTFLQLWDSWVVEQEEPGENNSTLLYSLPSYTLIHQDNPISATTTPINLTMQGCNDDGH
jgi:hypothetical protein